MIRATCCTWARPGRLTENDHHLDLLAALPTLLPQAIAWAEAEAARAPLEVDARAHEIDAL
jgi:hypothetical protein